MMVTAFRLILFVLSMSGFVVHGQKKFNIQVEFVPIISISFITVMLFFGGIFNILPVITYILFIIGIILLAKEFFVNFRNKKMFYTINQFITPGTVIIIVLSLYFIFILKDQRLIHYDNFSHWAVIVKNLLMDDALPNFEDTIISFNSYPPGSALFIYYFCKIVGTSEGLALIAQMLIVVSSILTIFSFSSFSLIVNNLSKTTLIKKLILNFMTVFVTIYLLNGPSMIQQLLVDTLISVVGIALFALIYYYLQSPNKIFIPVILLGSFLTLIKNSGMFFVLFALILYGTAIIKNKGIQDHMRMKFSLLPAFIAPIAIYYLWSQHVSMVFAADNLGKHTMSLKNYMAIFNEKTTIEIEEITEKFFSVFMDGYGIQFLLLIALVGIIVLIYYMTTKSVDKRLLVLSLVILIVFILYTLGLWIMYLVSMPTNESIRLAGYGRYMSTIMSYIIGVMAIGLIYSFNQSNSNLPFVISTSIALVFFLYLTVGEKYLDGTKSVFQRLELKVEEGIPNLSDIDASLGHLNPNPMLSTIGTSDYLVYFPNEDTTGYEIFYSKYRLYQEDITLRKRLDNVDEIWNHEYISISMVTEEITKIFETYSDEPVEVGTFRIDKENQRILTKIPEY